MDKNYKVVMFVSRNKDNSSLENFKERHKNFITTRDKDDERLLSEFENFANEGLPGEMSRLYYGVNERKNEVVNNQLVHFLIDNKDFNLAKVESKIASLAFKRGTALTNKWMFDFDEDVSLLSEFVKDVSDISGIEVSDIESHKTPNGYAVIVPRGFDTREILDKWKNVELKRDAMICIKWIRKG
ncbi:hypothetical protein [Enterococcus sp. AZ180]|uniref:hypothetical protein n=1 Tax=Enterococcus sp. AZ180 TaxID=2774961 RepID=UPI003F1FB8BC